MVRSRQVVLIDAGTGNLRSVGKALESLGAAVRLTSDPNDLPGASHVVMPGVGAFASFMSGLRDSGLADAVLQSVERGAAVLGICVGMQALFEVDEEMGLHTGLGLLPGRVVNFPPAPGCKVPHNGWNQLWPAAASPLTVGLTPGCYAVFNHSFYCEPAQASDVILMTDYGQPFASAVQRGSLYGVQFHPEKSQRVGLKLLQNFLRS